MVLAKKDNPNNLEGSISTASRNIVQEGELERRSLQDSPCRSYLPPKDITHTQNCRSRRYRGPYKTPTIKVVSEARPIEVLRIHAAIPAYCG